MRQSTLTLSYGGLMWPESGIGLHILGIRPTLYGTTSSIVKACFCCLLLAKFWLAVISSPASGADEVKGQF